MKAAIALFSIAMSFTFGSSLVQAEDANRLAELERRIVTLETQNQTLRKALEKLGGKTIQELAGLSVTSAAAPTPPAPSLPSGPTPEQIAAMQTVKNRIAAIEAMRKARKPDPFAGGPAIKTSKADAQKQQAAEEDELRSLRDQLAAMEAAIR